MDTLSICIIAKNEEKNLTKCMESVKDIADEFILIDTGSTDNTINIAQNYDAKIIKFPWKNDFSSARNKALDVASMNWILSIDSDESLDTSQIYDLKKSLNNTPYLGVKLKLINIINNKAFEGNHTLRIIKNNSGFYFSGKINERFENSVYGDNYVDKIFSSNNLLYNFGFDYIRKNLVERCERNLDIYLSSQEEKDYLYYYNIGNEYYLLKKYSLATTYYLKALNLNDNILINSYIALLIVKSYYNQKKYTKAISIGENFIVKYNLIREIYLLLSYCYERIGEFSLSKGYFKTYLNYPSNKYSHYFNLILNNSDKLIPEFFGFSILYLNNTLKY